MRITKRGQVTIPLDIRERLEFLPGTNVQFRIEGRVAILEKIHPRGSRDGAFLPPSRATGTVRMTTDEILALTRGPTGRGRTGRRTRT